jgi:cytochrome c oxidase subunit 4
VSKIPQRAISTSQVLGETAPVSANFVLDQKIKDEIHPKIGRREIVGYGFNGLANYVDQGEFPCPAIRFKEDTPEILALKEKEKGDWKALSIAEKKELYRASFCQTYAEMDAPTGEWKEIVTAVIWAFVATGWLLLFMKKVVYKPDPMLTPEARQEVVKQYIIQGQGPVTGYSSKWDYEKGQWKE